jgi:uncharacterized protein (TIGR02145 family)
MKGSRVIFLIFWIIWIFSLSVQFTSCKKLNYNSIPSIKIISLLNITDTSVKCTGKIFNTGNLEIIEEGFCWSENPNPTLEDQYLSNQTDSENFSNVINGLISDHIYFVRAFVVSNKGTFFSVQDTLITLIADIDGNLYHRVKIGNQVWMAENLKVTHYRNRDKIEGGDSFYYDYRNDPSNSTIYGRLYTWPAIMDERKITPLGWHVPTLEEWNNLIQFLGGENVAGGKLKEKGYSHWQSPNTGATNESGFTALPAGGFSAWAGESPFEYLGYRCYFWSSTGIYDSIIHTFRVSSIRMTYNQNNTTIDIGPVNEPILRSVRCIKDN